MIASVSTRTIIDAKLTVPNPPNDLVLRPAVACRLATAQTQSLTLICAPAGYGKTTAVAAWLRSQADLSPAMLVAWYALDESDDHFFTFVTYLAAAIERVLPGVCRQVTASLQEGDLPAPDHLAALLLADLAHLPQRLTLVLDDYHHVHAPAIHALMIAVVQHPPPLLHLVVITRSAPALPLAKLRAAHAVVEFGAAQLAFTLAEVRQLLEMIVGRTVEAENVASLHARTEGWVAGLRLLTLVTPDHSDGAGDNPAAEGRSQHLLFDYLAQEVLANLPAPRLTFLLESSILTTLNADLCDAVCSPSAGEASNSAAQLRQLVQDNLFIAEIDEQDGWYRYHPQFQSCLRKQLHLARPPAAIKQLYARAAGWYGAHGYVTESMLAYLAADLPARAADQLERSLADLYRREQMQLLHHLVGLLPPALVAARPALLMLQGWLAELRSQWAIMRQCAEEAARLLESSVAPAGPTPAQTVWGEIYAARSYYLLSGATLAQQQAAAEQALALLPADHIQGRGFALINLARIYRWQGRLAEAERLLEQAVDAQGLHPHAITLRLLNALALHHMYTLQLDQAARVGQLHLALAGESGLKLSEGFAHSLLGIVACLRTQLDQADDHFTANAAALQTVRASVLLAQIYLYILLAGSGSAERRQAIVAVLDRLHRLARQQGSAEMLRTVEALQAAAALQRGDTITALRWVQERPCPPIIPGKPLESLIWVRGKLADGTPAALQAAQAALVQLVAVTAQYHDAGFHLEAQVLHSLLAFAQGREAESLALLRPAVQQAVAQRAPLAFCGHRPVIRRLLERLAAEPALNPTVLALVDLLDGVGDQAARERTRPTQADAPPLPPADTLTHRELQIVELLAQRLSNAEIAAALVISPHTVRNHLANLYAKLGATSRRAAVVQAQRLGLIPHAVPPG